MVKKSDLVLHHLLKPICRLGVGNIIEYFWHSTVDQRWYLVIYMIHNMRKCPLSIYDNEDFANATANICLIR